MLNRSLLAQFYVAGMVTAGLVAVANPANAAAVWDSTNATINNLDIDGQRYNVSFSGGSYNTVYGTSTPTFFGNFAGARNAANAIASFFSSNDGFEALPNTFSFNNGGQLSSGLIPIFSDFDGDIRTVGLVHLLSPTPSAEINAVIDGIFPQFPTAAGIDSDEVFFASNYTVFEAVEVPTPALLPGLIGLGIGALRRKRAVAAEEKA